MNKKSEICEKSRGTLEAYVEVELRSIKISPQSLVVTTTGTPQLHRYLLMRPALTSYASRQQRAIQRALQLLW